MLVFTHIEFKVLWPILSICGKHVFRIVGFMLCAHRCIGGGT